MHSGTAIAIVAQSNCIPHRVNIGGALAALMQLCPLRIHGSHAMHGSDVRDLYRLLPWATAIYTTPHEPDPPAPCPSLSISIPLLSESTSRSSLTAEHRRRAFLSLLPSNR